MSQRSQDPERLKRDPQKRRWARHMRPTPENALLWEHLRRRQVGGWKFRRRAILRGWIVPFWCPEARLVVDVVPASRPAGADARRNAVLEQLGIRVLAIPAADVQDALPAALARVRDALAPSPPPTSPRAAATRSRPA